ncbi:hypothetical protein ACFOWU_04775 [Epilithonimonas zeae]|uniref:Uncharacterized protein n=1 Tax=Epilithonimonas zeae TaxID=1416779 RepID=A0A1N6F2H9_9FLAO|nr:hypothetical protein [Epilithonimonas zeae]SIN89490.1 hypothetical protein SAMN05444409_1008 [Epilithonimonas zeae]
MQNLKSKYEQQEMKVSDSLWDRLEEKLDEVSAKEKKPKVIWWRFVAVIILIVNFGAISWMTDIKNKVKENPGFEFRTDQISSVRQPHGNNNEIQKPVSINSETDNQKLAVENKDSSTPLRMTNSIKKEIQIQNSILEKDTLIKKEEPQIVSKPEEQLAQTDIQKPKEKVKYVSSSDLLFGVEIDKAKAETPKSAMGINTIKSKNDSDFPNPKRIKLFGITLYDKDSTTAK